jgi:hypothetical protein
MNPRKTLGLGVTAEAGLAAALLPAAAAAAATPGKFTLCSQGPYSSYASFPARGGMQTQIIPQGACRTYDLGGSANEQVNVYKYLSAGGQLIGSTIYNGSVGEKIVTIAGPSFYIA